MTSDLEKENNKLREQLEEMLKRLGRIKRACEMSAQIMRDPERTGHWEGAERVAQQFDQIAERATMDE